MKRRVVITGMGAITPLGNDLQATWKAVLNSRSGIDHITQFDASTFPVRIAAEVKNFSPEQEDIPDDMQTFTGRSARLCLATAKMALRDSGIELDREDPRNIGISLGGDEEYLHFDMIERIYSREHTYNAFVEGQEAYCELLKRSSQLAKIWPVRKKTDIGSKLLSRYFNLQGPSATSHTSCSSSGHGIGKAKRFIEDGDCDIVVTGGHCSMVSEFSVAGFYLLGTLSTCNEEPQKSSKPFDLNRDGFILGEGSGILVVEELDHALKRGARIYAELSGYGSSSNAYRLTDTPPDGRGGDLSMKRALADAGIDVSRVDYINAHGTGTLVNDRSETLSIKNVFGDTAGRIPISSSKSMIGHLVCSSSAVELVITVMAVRENVAPPTINYEARDPQCDLDYVPNTPREHRIAVALSNSFAFGGQNATLAVQKFEG